MCLVLLKLTLKFHDFLKGSISGFNACGRFLIYSQYKIIFVVCYTAISIFCYWTKPKKYKISPNMVIFVL